MIGNDVIDLSLAQKQSNWKRKGFLDKIFTKREQELILNSANPETTVWNLWSRKEAAYKIYNRQTQQMAFIPIQLECFDLDEKEGSLYGKVVCYDNIYFTKTAITFDCVETVAVTDLADFKDIRYLNSETTIIKIDGIPNHLDAKTQTLQPMSKSHHGRFQKQVTL